MKQTLILSGPVDTMSGYGARARDVVKSLIKTGKYDIKILSQRWGSTPMGFLDPSKKDHKEILDLILPKNNEIPYQPDVWIQISVPNEFQKIGKYSIGITAGIETTLCDASWVEGVNRMDLILVSSNHAKIVFENSKFETRDRNTNNLINKIEVKTPIKVLFEGVDTRTYFKYPNPPHSSLVNYENTELDEVLNEIPEDFNFLFVGHWLKGDLGEDRKNVGMLIKTFLETFKDKPNQPGLILKTSGGSSSILDREAILEKIRAIMGEVKGKLPTIHLLHGDLTDEEMNELYNHSKVKAMVNITKGEGYGRPLLEFTNAQKPLITSGWSGQLDFLNKEYVTLLPGKITAIHHSAVMERMLLPEAQWFTVDYNAFSEAMKNIYSDYKTFVEKAKRQSYISRTKFSLEEMGKQLEIILDENVVKEVKLKLPNLKKI
jgi:glycosyltransferase involved in cell wall biosynthesis